MAKPSRLRLHYIPEWAEKRGLSQADIVRALGGRADKSTVSRWFAGSIPDEENLLSLQGIFALDDVRSLFRHPDDDWLTRFFRKKTEADKSRFRQLLELAFPDSKAS